MLGFARRFSTAYHPQTDGSTERVNRSALQILRAGLYRTASSQWVAKLPEAEFAYNSRIHSAIGLTPFQAHYGFNPSFGEYSPASSTGMISLTDRLDKLSTGTKRSQEAMEKQYNKRRRTAMQYAIGDEVLLDTAPYRRNDAKANVSAKLSNRWQGPYTIKEILHPDVYSLNLPANSKLHNSFNTTVLKPYKLTPRGKFPERDLVPLRPDPVNVGEENHYVVDNITAHDFKGRTAYKLRFKVLWEGFPESEATWEPARDIYETAPDAVNAYRSILGDGPRNMIDRALNIHH